MVGLNHYAYAGNDPINHVDINGLGWGHWFKKLFHSVVKAVVHIGQQISHLAQQIARIPIIGGLVVAAIALTPELGFMWATADFKGWSRAAASGVVHAAAIALTIFSAGLATPLMIAADAAIGAADGYATAKINGANDKQALRGAMLGAAMSAGTAACSAFYQAACGTIPDTYGDGPNTIGIKQFQADIDAGKPVGFFEEGGTLSRFIRDIPLIGHVVNAVSGLHDYMGGTFGPPGTAAESCSGWMFGRTLSNLPYVGTPINVALMAPAGAITVVAEKATIGAYLFGDVQLGSSANAQANGSSPNARLAGAH
jgi:hypothetical protein